MIKYLLAFLLVSVTIQGSSSAASSLFLSPTFPPTAFESQYY